MAEEFGRVLASWKVPSFEKHTRTIAWYIGFGILGTALFIYAIRTINYLFALLIIITAFIVYIQEISEPEPVDIEITVKGIKIGRKTYPYKDLKNFWIIYEPPVVKKLYFSFKGALVTRVMIPLLDQNPLRIREILLQFLEEDLNEEHEPLSEVISRWVKM